MITVELSGDIEKPLDILCLGAHADDIEIGCGGTILGTLSKQKARLTWVVFGAEGERADEASRSARSFLGSAESQEIIIHQFPDGGFPGYRADIKNAFEALKGSVDPQLIFVHDEADLHQDHRVLGTLCRETFRDHLILGYEIPKYDGDLHHPNVFVQIDDSARKRKIDLIMDSFPSQREKHWFDARLFDGLMRVRGVECASPSGYAEAFHCRTLMLGL